MSKQSPSPGAADGPGNPEPQLGKTNATQAPVDLSKKAELGLGVPGAPDGPGNPEPQLGKTNATQAPVDLSKKAELGLGAPGAPDGPGNPEPQLGKTNATQAPVDLSKKAELGLGVPGAPDGPGSPEPQLGKTNATQAPVDLSKKAELGLGVPGAPDGPGNPEPQLGKINATQVPVDISKKAELGLGVPRGWHSRGYLPHFDSTDVLQSITFRLADSLPQSKLRQLEVELKHLPPNTQNLVRRRQSEEWLDAGMGCCALRHPLVAAMVVETLELSDPKRYALIAWCVMPNHVHVLIEPRVSVSKIVQSWKSYAGRWMMQRNAALGLDIPGAERKIGDPKRTVWMRDYWDRYIRNEGHLQRVVEYIHANPVKAGLCRKPRDWRWSSASVE